MNKSPINLPASVRQRLLNLAGHSRQDFGLLLTKYSLERLLYRLSVSKHRNTFVLKGAPFCFNCGPRSLIVQHETWICSAKGTDQQSATAGYSRNCVPKKWKTMA